MNNTILHALVIAQQRSRFVLDNKNAGRAADLAVTLSGADNAKFFCANVTIAGVWDHVKKAINIARPLTIVAIFFETCQGW